MKDFDETYDDQLDDDAIEPSVDDALPSGGSKPIAYVRALTAAEIAGAPDDIRGAATVALHDEDGRALALFPDRDSAIAAAMVNDFEPVSVH